MAEKINKNYALEGIKLMDDRKRFEYYVGWILSKELKCDRYHQGIKYSLKKEIEIIEKILDEQNDIKPEQKKKVINKLNEYENSVNKSLRGFPSSSSENESDKKNTLSNNDTNNKNEINNIDTEKNKNNFNNINSNINNVNNISYVNKKNSNENIINNNIDNISVNNTKSDNSLNTSTFNNDKNIISNNSSNRNNNKREKIAGDFDIIIPNISKKNMQLMVEKNFYYYNKDKYCIIFDENKLSYIPDIFHLFIEVGLSSFDNNMSYKAKQINKYISVLNLESAINNDKIKMIYRNDFQKRYSLHLNSEKNKIANTYIYMLISNSDLGTFTSRFLDKKTYKKDNNYEFNKILPKESKEILFCGFVDFEKNLNSSISLEIKIDEHEKKIEKLNKEVERLLRAFNRPGRRQRRIINIKKSKKGKNKENGNELEE